MAAPSSLWSRHASALSCRPLPPLCCFPPSYRADEPTIAATEFRSPADELKALRLPPGFEAQLVAAEPDIQKPINLAFDAKGRLWVTCTIEYPFPAAEGKGRDSVKVLSDFGPDGKARKVETFADGLNIPIGVLAVQGRGDRLQHPEHLAAHATPTAMRQMRQARGAGVRLRPPRHARHDQRPDARLRRLGLLQPRLLQRLGRDRAPTAPSSA